MGILEKFNDGTPLSETKRNKKQSTQTIVPMSGPPPGAHLGAEGMFQLAKKQSDNCGPTNLQLGGGTGVTLSDFDLTQQMMASLASTDPIDFPTHSHVGPCD